MTSCLSAITPKLDFQRLEGVAFRRPKDKRRAVRGTGLEGCECRVLSAPLSWNLPRSFLVLQQNSQFGEGTIRLGSLEACQIDIDLLAEKWWTPAAPLN